MNEAYALSDEQAQELAEDHKVSLRWLPDRTYEQYLAGRIAPVGKVWRCGACGKTTKDRHSEGGGWDESCMLNSYLVAASEIGRCEEGK